MLDVCICFVSNIHSSFQIQERFVRACGWMCALVALRTDGDGRTIHSAPTTSPASHTHSQTQYLCGAVEGGGSPACTLQFCLVVFFFFSRSRRRGSRAASGDECRLSTTPRPLTVRLRPREVERTLARVHFLGAKAKQGCEVCRSAARRHGFLVTSSLHLLSASSVISFLLSV